MAVITVVWLCGPTAVGKSTVGFEIYQRSNRSGVHTAFVDLDQIGFHHPVPANDPGNHRLKAANLAAIWPAFSTAGARRLVIVGPVNSPDAIAAYRAALPAANIIVYRLHAGRRALTERVRLRGLGHGPPIAGDDLVGQSDAVLQRAADRATADAEALDAAGIGDVRIDTDGRSVSEVADFCQWWVT
jgi:hypothetical protein